MTNPHPPKKPYVKPELTSHGAVETITLAAFLDQKRGNQIGPPEISPVVS